MAAKKAAKELKAAAKAAKKAKKSAKISPVSSPVKQLSKVDSHASLSDCELGTDCSDNEADEEEVMPFTHESMPGEQLYISASNIVYNSEEIRYLIMIQQKVE